MRGIRVIGVSAGRLLSTMSLSSKLQADLNFNVSQLQEPNQSTLPPTWSNWFSLQQFSDIVFVEDTIHLGVKL